MDLALNNLQRLICHKNPTNHLLKNLPFVGSILRMWRGWVNAHTHVLI